MSEKRKPEQQHLPLNSNPGLLSEDKRKWCASSWNKRALKQPRIAVFHYAMNSTPRPTAPDETIAYGFMTLNKFHDREPEAIRKTIEALDPEWFDSYPKKEGTDFDDSFKKAVIGELARAFYRHGLAAYGKPGLRKSESDEVTNSPLAAL